MHFHNSDDDEDNEWNNRFIIKDNNKISKVVQINNQKDEKNNWKDKGKKIRNKYKKIITEFNNDIFKTIP